MLLSSREAQPEDRGATRRQRVKHIFDCLSKPNLPCQIVNMYPLHDFYSGGLWKSSTGHGDMISDHCLMKSIQLGGHDVLPYAIYQSGRWPDTRGLWWVYHGLTLMPPVPVLYTEHTSIPASLTSGQARGLSELYHTQLIFLSPRIFASCFEDRMGACTAHSEHSSFLWATYFMDACDVRMLKAY